MGVLLLLTRLTLAGLAVLVLLRVLGVGRSAVLALLVGALPLTLLPAYGAVVLGAACRRQRLTLAALALVVAHLLVVAPAVTAEAIGAGAAGAPRLRVATANLYVLNTDPQAAGRALRELRPDVLVVTELSPEGLEGLRASGLLDDLPSSVVRFESRVETVGLFSRLPLSGTTTRSAAFRELPRGSVVVDGVEVRVLPAHPLPPVSVLAPLWRASLEDLAAEVEQIDLPLVVAGDLNADRDHAPLRRLLDAGLRDAHDSRGRGLARTWPAAFPLLHLDHVLVRDGVGGRLEVLEVREVRVPGSDHLAVVADLAVIGS